MVLNGASTTNIRVREKLKKMTVANALSNGDNFLFVLHIIFELRYLLTFYLYQSETPDNRPETDATDRREKFRPEN